MKFIKLKSLIITDIICLIPILLGVLLWDMLPDTMAIHFDINNVADNFASKGFVVFCLPLLMVVLQTICCFINDINGHKYGERKKFEKARKINRFVGFITVIMGILSFVTILLPSISTVIWLIMLIPYAITNVVYGIKVCRNK